MKKQQALTAGLMLTFIMIQNMLAAPTCSSLELKNNYIFTAVSCDATLGYGSVQYPGIQYDATGKGIFNDPEDIIIPGAPHEIFSIKYNNIRKTNSNSSYTRPSMPTFISGYGDFITAISTVDNKLKVIHTYTLLENSKVLSVRVSIENITTTTITGVKYLRSVDPDYNLNEFSTNNKRGNSVYSPENFVQADLPNGGAIALFTLEKDIIHNTSITEWTKDPDVSLEGIDVGNGDNTIDISFNLENLLPGEKKSFEFGYLLTTNTAESTDATNNAIELVENQGFILEQTAQNAQGTDIAATIIKSEKIKLTDIPVDVPYIIKDFILKLGLDLEATEEPDFTYTLTFTLPSSSKQIFTGYYIFSRETQEWKDLGSIYNYPTTIGYDISDDGQSMIVVLKDQVRGDDSTSIATLKHVGFPLVDSEPREHTQYTTTEQLVITKSVPMSDTVKSGMILLFIFIAYLGLRRKEKKFN